MMNNEVNISAGYIVALIGGLSFTRAATAVGISRAYWAGPIAAFAVIGLTVVMIVSPPYAYYIVSAAALGCASAGLAGYIQNSSRFAERKIAGIPLLRVILFTVPTVLGAYLLESILLGGLLGLVAAFSVGKSRT